MYNLAMSTRLKHFLSYTFTTTTFVRLSHCIAVKGLLRVYILIYYIVPGGTPFPYTYSAYLFQEKKLIALKMLIFKASLYVLITRK